MFISDIAIKRPVFTSMIILSLALFGWVSLRRLPLELFPKVELPVITITTPLRGADPETIETRVSDPIEGAVNTVSGIKKLQSTSMEGASVVAIEFQLEKNVDVAYQEVQQKVNSVRSQLPPDIDEPIVQKISFDAAPVMTLVVSGDLSARELYRTADQDIRERLQHVKNVGMINIIGGRDRKLWLWLDPARLKQHNLTVKSVRDALDRQHVEMPGGRVENGRQELITRVKAEYESAEQLDGLILSETDGATVRLKDVGHTEDGLEEERSYAQRDSMPCITLEIQRQSGTNTVQVVDDLKAEIAKISAEQAKRGVTIETAVDMSNYVRESVSQVYHHLVVGGLLAVATILVFLLNFRSTFISALVLPTSILATFMMLSVMGFTINFMTLMALQLAIGLLIDDAIVVQENIMRHIEAGKPSRFAAAFATREIGLAVLATTLSVVAVFMPTAFTRGIVGQFFFPFGMTVSFAVLISMLVSFTLDPMLSSRMLRKRTSRNRVFAALEHAFAVMERLYERVLNRSVRHRWMVAGTALLIFVASMFFGAKFAKSEFQPEEDRSEFSVNLRSPLGSSLAVTREIAERVRDVVRSVPEVRYTVYSIGGTSSGGAEGKINVGSMYVRLLDKAQRQAKGLRSQRAVMDHLRDELAVSKLQGRDPAHPGPVAVSVQPFDVMANSSGFKSSIIQLELLGPDLTKLDALSKEMLERMKKAGGYKDLDTTYEPGRPEVSVLVDRDRAADLGVTPRDIGDTIRAGVGGVDIGKFRSGKDRYDIAVRLLESGRNDSARILDLAVPSTKGTPVELRTVARVMPSSVPVEINRFNRQRQITVLANLETGKPLGDATKELRNMIAQMGLPGGYSVAWTGQVEIMEESFANLGFTMMLSVVVIFMVLAAQFESVVHPLTIMLSLPLAFVGAIVSLVIFRQTVNIMTMMAFTFLLGLVTKNAILLIDYANTLRKRDGLSALDAIRRAAPVRLRPILMTTLAMIVGMLPSALGTGEGAESRQPMAVAIIGGLISSTFLTLLVVPVVYLLLDPISEFLRRKVIDPEGAIESEEVPVEKAPAPRSRDSLGVN